jgi:hypothetical protein
LLVLSFALLVSVGCSEETGESVRTHPRTTPEPTLAGGTGGEGYYAGAPAVPRHGVTVERAELRPGSEDDQIVVRVSVGRSVISPDCYIVSKSAREAVTDGETPTPMVFESDWADDRLTDTFEKGDTFVVVFYEKQPAPEKTASPRLTTLYAGCYGRGMTAYDEARVEGAPGAR